MTGQFLRDHPLGLSGLAKAATGIRGFDEVTGGGLPRGRPTLVTGSAGAGKTLFGLEFLVHGAVEFAEPGVLFTFEESLSDLTANVASLGWDLAALERDGALAVDAFRIDPAEYVETGEFDLEGLFIRLDAAVRSVGAKRVLLDTIEVLLSALPNPALIRGELVRLFRWLRERGLTAVVTGERGGAGQLTRFGIEEYVSDCVVSLDHRVCDEVSTRRLRVIKYRGSQHGTNEYPFVITDRGLAVLPITSMRLEYEASTERISTGISSLDVMLGGGVYRGSTVLLSGMSGSGKTSLAAHMAEAACARGDKVLFVQFEESPSQLVRNMRSIGLDLQRWIDAGLLLVWAVRPTAYGLEEHIVSLGRLLDDVRPSVAVLDAIGSLGHSGLPSEVSSAASRDIDILKGRGITTVLTTLTDGGHEAENSSLAVSSLVDSWVLLRNVEGNGERNRLLLVIKSRGMAHSNQAREFVLTDRGAELLDPYVGPGGVVTGSARIAQEAEERAEATARAQDVERMRDRLSRRSVEVDTQIAVLREQLAAEVAEFDRVVDGVSALAMTESADRSAMARQRWSTAVKNATSGTP